MNVADKAAVAIVQTWMADSNNVTGRSDVNAGSIAQRRVLDTDAVGPERFKTAGRIPTAGRVTTERVSTGGRVELTGGVAKKRITTGGRVEAAGAAMKCLKADGGVVGAVAQRQRSPTEGAVLNTVDVAKELIASKGRIGVAKAESAYVIKKSA